MMTRDSAPQKLDASMFPTLPKHGTRVARTPAAQQGQSQRASARPRPQGKAGEPTLASVGPCDMCGNPAARPKCGRCWGVVSGLASLRREHPAAYEAFVDTLG